MDADVEVVDPQGCVDAAILGEELGGRLVGPMTIVVVQHGVGQRREVVLAAVRDRRVIWEGAMSFVAGECPGVEEKIGNKVVGGLVEVCPECLVTRRSARTELTLPVLVSVGVDDPADARAGLGVGLLHEPGGCCLVAELDGEIGLPVPMAGDGGTAESAAARLRVGWQVEPAGALTLAAGLGGGGVASWGSTAPAGTVGLAPAADAWISAGFFSDHHARVGLRVRANLVRLEYRTRADVVPEPWVRAEVWVAPVLFYAEREVGGRSRP